MLTFEGPTGAVFSADKSCRFYLWRIWDRNKDNLVCIGLNPSKASENENDNTITKVCKIARHNSFGGVVMLNLFCYISTNPKELIIDPNELRPYDDIISEMLQHPRNANVCFCWGAFKQAKGRQDDVINLVHSWGALTWCINKNNDGTPVHPLFQADNSKLIPFK